MKRKELELFEEGRKKLLEIVEKGQGLTHRSLRADATLFSAGWQAKAIVEQQDLNSDTVYNRR